MRIPTQHAGQHVLSSLMYIVPHAMSQLSVKAQILVQKWTNMEYNTNGKELYLNFQDEATEQINNVEHQCKTPTHCEKGTMKLSPLWHLRFHFFPPQTQQGSMS